MAVKKAAKKQAPAPQTASRKTASKKIVTLAIDIGGTGLKMMLLDPAGKPLTERARVKTPDNPTPKAVESVLLELSKTLPAFDRVSVGFPGVVKHGVIHTAPNLTPEWDNYPVEKALSKMWKKPVRVMNDAVVQGIGVITGEGIELVITLGTGMGSALYVDGHICPLELGHHPWRSKTYEDYLGKNGLKKHGKKRWNKLVEEAIEQTSKTFNWDALYIGGGNNKFIEFKPAKGVSVISNEEGLLGGAALWRNR